ncbi:protein archease-like isoform X1 [Neodiprion pinetum]|uniref:protein archease-like isoform X1 n=1 Tax=Neodiprion pinetum TaxID=441929 RepID=UPI001EDF697E|nr:protein archease-like isoform X1 [Neodiprion pinetum]
MTRHSGLSGKQTEEQLISVFTWVISCESYDGRFISRRPSDSANQIRILHAWGESLQEAFEQCAMAMFGYMTDLDRVEMTEVHHVEAEGDDLHSLLFHFLDELLFMFSAERFIIPKKVKITEMDRENFKIKATAIGEEFTLGKHPQGTEVKAITYSAMQILDRPDAERPEVFVIIDI